MEAAKYGSAGSEGHREAEARRGRDIERAESGNACGERPLHGTQQTTSHASMTTVIETTCDKRGERDVEVAAARQSEGRRTSKHSREQRGKESQRHGEPGDPNLNILNWRARREPDGLAAWRERASLISHAADLRRSTCTPSAAQLTFRRTTGSIPWLSCASGARASELAPHKRRECWLQARIIGALEAGPGRSAPCLIDCSIAGLTGDTARMLLSR